MSVEQLDTIVRTGQALGRVVDSLDREHLKALADRLDLTHRSTEETRRGVKRRLLGVFK